MQHLLWFIFMWRRLGWRDQKKRPVRYVEPNSSFKNSNPA